LNPEKKKISFPRTLLLLQIQITHWHIPIFEGGKVITYTNAPKLPENLIIELQSNCC